MWLKNQHVITIWDIEDYIESMYQISTSYEYLRERKGNEMKIYQREEIAYRRTYYNEIYSDIETEWRGVIAKRKGNGQLIIQSVLLPIVNRNMNENPLQFNEQLTIAIQSNKGYTALDASAKYKHMRGHWIIINKEQTIEVKNTLFHEN